MSKILVAYFSPGNVTRLVAKKIADQVKGDLYEIEPEIPYTEEDLDWQNKKSRSSLEAGDLTSRPAIKGKVENIAEYDELFVGFPIWWYAAPTIINTFLEAHDLKGKKIFLFATSATSGMDKVVEGLKASAPDSEFAGEKRFQVSPTNAEVNQWLVTLSY